MSEEYKILCSGNISFGERGFLEKDFAKDVNKESDYYDAISIGGTENRICVLMRKKSIITSI